MNYANATETQLRRLAMEEAWAFRHTSRAACATARWRFVPAYPVERLLRIMPRQAWLRWYEDQHLARCRPAMGPFRHCPAARAGLVYYPHLEVAWLDNPVGVGPLVIAESQRGIDIGDGWHRAAISIKYRLVVVPALVARCG